MADKLDEYVKRIEETLQQLTESVDVEAFALSKKYEDIGEAMCACGYRIKICEHSDDHTTFFVDNHLDYSIVGSRKNICDLWVYYLVHTYTKKPLYASSNAQQIAEEYRRCVANDVLA